MSASNPQQAVTNLVSQLTMIQQQVGSAKTAALAISGGNLNPGGDLQNQIDGLVMQLQGMQKTLKQPQDQTIGMLPAWCVRVMAKVPTGTVF
jgi:hypothetical protein